MKKTTIERAFSLGLLCAEKIHGRGLQAEICRRTEVDSSNLNSIMKKEKGARETTRREIFNAVSFGHGQRFAVFPQVHRVPN